MKTIIIGARASNLAQKQALIVKEKLLKVYNNVNIIIKQYSTKGDQRLDINWKNSPESLKGLFTNELEQALLENDIDIAVHSLKDMPTDFNRMLSIAAYVDYQDERDVFLSINYDNLASLPKNAVVGTSSSRREMQLKDLRNDINVKVIRGNIETRIKKLENNEYDAIILAAAGLIRTNNLKYVKEYFNDDQMISASGQGILCLQTRKNDYFLNNMIKQIVEDKVEIKAKIERTFSIIFDGGCTTPMGCNAKIVNNRIMFKGMYYHNNIRYDGYVEGNIYEKEAIAYRLSNQIKNQYILNKGTVYLVGAGPGSIDMLTIKAYNLIKEADCILYDRLVSEEILSLANKNCQLEYVGKESHEMGLSQALINEQLINACFNYKKIVRLKSGDPFVYGRGYEEILALNNYNIKYEVIPGVSSANAASGYSGIPLTDRNTASSFHVFSGHGKNNEYNLDYKSIVNLDGTLVFYMAIKNIANISKKLVEHGMTKETEVAFIENAASINQRIVTCKITEVAKTIAKNKIKAPAIIIIGDVVKLKNNSQWFNSKKKLTLLSTREEKYFNKFMQKASEFSFNSLSAPQINVVPCNQCDTIHIDKYDIILFNSVNGVKYFFERYPILNKKYIIGAVGQKTQSNIEKNGYSVNIIPKISTMNELINTTNSIYYNKNILVIASKQTKLDLILWQRRSLNKIDMISCYDTMHVEYDYNILKQQILCTNVICFFSTSGVTSFLKNINYNIDLLKNKKIASIGPTTTQELLLNNITVDIQAKVATQEGLIKTIKEYFDV